ncbi:unnamed protein product [Fusarium graminearum]|nr:unnamed protein product [Fusarium graminearum]CAG1973237.1 unnamed protein product [Fusarium graminearum]CAG2011581.1 unnamed protein product [Fusarium graminearum]
MTLWATIAILIHVPTISIVLQALLTLTLGHNLSTGLFIRNVPANSILTFAILKRYRLGSRTAFNPTFVAWMSSMLLEIEWLTSYCQDDSNGWHRISHFALLLGQIGFMLWICLYAAYRTLPINERQNHIRRKFHPIEQRKIQRVYFVSSPAFGPKWLVSSLYRAHDRAVFHLCRVAIWATVYVRRPLVRKALMLIGKGGVEVDDNDDEFLTSITPILQGREHAKAMETTSRSLTLFTLAYIVFAITGETPIVFVAMFSLWQKKHGFVWNIVELVCHYALEIDDEYFELRRVGDSIELSRKPVSKPQYFSGPSSNNQEPERNVLSRTFVGYTFLTKDEIEEKGKHLVAISPSYDALNFNCQGVRNNLFDRIFDDRATSLNRMNIGWVSAHTCLLQGIAQWVFVWQYNLNINTTTINIKTSKTVWGKATAALPLLWIGLAVLILINSISGIVSCVSTFEGKRFRFRTTIPQLLAPILILRALPVVTRKLNILSPVKQVICLLLILRYTLMTVHYVNVLWFRQNELVDPWFKIVRGDKLKSANSALLTNVNYNDFAFDPIRERWISRKVLPCWSWEIEEWEEWPLFISGIMTLGGRLL